MIVATVGAAVMELEILLDIVEVVGAIVVVAIAIQKALAFLRRKREGDFHTRR